VSISTTEDFILVTDYGSSAVRKMVISSGVVTTILEGVDWFHPLAVTFDYGTGDAYVSDLHRIVLALPADLEPAGNGQVIAGSHCKYNLTASLRHLTITSPFLSCLVFSFYFLCD